MNKADKSVKTAGKAAQRKAGRRQAGAARHQGRQSRAAKPAAKAQADPRKAAPAAADDAPVIALNLPPAKLSPAMAAYFKKCQDKLGFVPERAASPTPSTWPSSKPSSPCTTT